MFQSTPLILLDCSRVINFVIILALLKLHRQHRIISINTRSLSCTVIHPALRSKGHFFEQPMTNAPPLSTLVQTCCGAGMACVVLPDSANTSNNIDRLNKVGEKNNMKFDSSSSFHSLHANKTLFLWYKARTERMEYHTSKCQEQKNETATRIDSLNPTMCAASSSSRKKINRPKQMDVATTTDSRTLYSEEIRHHTTWSSRKKILPSRGGYPRINLVSHRSTDRRDWGKQTINEIDKKRYYLVWFLL